MALKAMRELPDYIMAPGSPDVEGWQVHDRNHQVVGTVVDLIVDTRGDEVRYLAVQQTDGRTVLLPLGDLDLDESRGIIRSVTRTREELSDLPVYTPPSLTPEIEERYYVLFRREEPIGAADMSPLDYRIPPFRARGDRMESLVRGPQRTIGTRVPIERGEPAESTRREGRMERRAGRDEGLEQRLEDRMERRGERRDTRPPGPVKGMPGEKPGLFAAQEPWVMADKSEDPAVRGEFDHLGPDAEREVLWQSEQPGVRSALGVSRDLPEEKP